MMVPFAVALLVLALGAAAWFFYACTLPTSKFFRPVLVRGPVQNRTIALTFDDGPAPPFTEQVLDVLRAKNVTATFFVCGQNVERYPEITRRIAREGHTLGNHTFSHPLLYMRSRRFIADEIDRTQKAIESAAGVRAEVFRPPYGGRWPGLMEVLGIRGLKLVMWSATGYDWRLTKNGIVNSVLREISPGAVLLLHDGRNVDPADGIDRAGTVQALPEIIDKARVAGYEFVPITKFLQA
jgi:peptidoglycan-N-acetylglucosamine deacetylase